MAAKPDPHHPFSRNYQPKVDWRPTKQIATRTSADGDAMRIRSRSQFPVTHPRKKKS